MLLCTVHHIPEKLVRDGVAMVVSIGSPAVFLLADKVHEQSPGAGRVLCSAETEHLLPLGVGNGRHSEDNLFLQQSSGDSHVVQMGQWWSSGFLGEFVSIG